MLYMLFFFCTIFYTQVSTVLKMHTIPCVHWSLKAKWKMTAKTHAEVSAHTHNLFGYFFIFIFLEGGDLWSDDIIRALFAVRFGNSIDYYLIVKPIEFYFDMISITCTRSLTITHVQCAVWWCKINVCVFISFIVYALAHARTEKQTNINAQ